jgi:Uma2 family endonuclease
VISSGAVQAPELKCTYAEYLALEHQSEVKHEYFAGRVYAMSGGTPEHGRLAARVIALLEAQLGGRSCATFTSDVRVRIPATDVALYPDVSVVCDKLERVEDDPDAIVNPRVLVEVLSKSSAKYDREEKFAQYRRIASLECYVLVSQTERLLEVFTRNTDGTWTLRDVREGEARIDAIGCQLAVEAVYRDPLAS